MDTVRTLCVQGKDISSNSPELPTVRQRLLDHVVQTANPETHWCSYWGRAALVAEIGCHWGSICRERASLVFMGMIRVVPRKEAAAYGITARTTVVQLLEPAIRMRQQGSATLKGALPEAAAASASDPSADLTPDQQQLDAQLRAWRKAQSERIGLPQFFVLGASTLRSIVLLRPRTLAQLQTISGIGPEKADRFGEDIIALCRA